MPSTIRVRWTITPLLYPQPWRTCSRCNLQRAFRCSEKFRLNANGKRLDAWLIYNCVECGDRWNFPMFERTAANAVSGEVLAAIQGNDIALVRHHAFDVVGLRKRSHRVEAFDEMEVSKQCIGIAESACAALEIGMAVAGSCSMRLDRLLAAHLSLPRSRLAALAKAGLLSTTSPLNKPVRDGSRVSVSLLGESPATIIERASGGL